MSDPEIVEEKAQVQAPTLQVPEVSFPLAAFSLMKEFSQVQDSNAMRPMEMQPADGAQSVLLQENDPVFVDEQDEDRTQNFLSSPPAPLAVDVSKQTVMGGQFVPASSASPLPASQPFTVSLPQYDGKFAITFLTLALICVTMVALLSTIFDPAIIAVVNTYGVDNSVAQLGKTPTVGVASSHPPLTPSSAQVSPPAKKPQPLLRHKGKNGGTSTSGGTTGGTQSVPQSKSTPVPTPATSMAAVPVTGAYYYVMNRYSGLVLDDTNWSTSDGMTIQQWTEVSGQADQEWSLSSAGSGYYYIVNRYSGLVLDDTNWSTSDGTTIQQWTEVSGQADQEWSLSSAGSGYYYIVNRYSGLVLDDTNWSTSDGTTIQQWTEVSGQADQEWMLAAT